MPKLSTGGPNDHHIEKVIRSPFFLRVCASADLLTITEYATDTDYVGGFYGGDSGMDRVTPFACLVFRVLFLINEHHHHHHHHHHHRSDDNNDEDTSRSNNSIKSLTASFVDEWVAQPHHKYLRVFGIVCLRLLASSAAESNRTDSFVKKLHRALDVGFKDYRRVRVMLPATGAVVVSTVDAVCDDLLFNNNKLFLGLHLPMIPSRRQMLELYPELKEELI